MPPLTEIARGVSTRLKKRQRGFHFEKEPGFFNMSKSFGNAAKQKTASYNALKRIATKYALLDETGEPIESLAKLFLQSNFGYGDNPVQPKKSGDPTWGANMGMPLETGDRNGLSRSLSYGGV